MNEIKVTEYLTWQYSDDPIVQNLNCPAPAPVRNHLPQWFKNLRGNIQEYLPEGFGQQHTVRHCLGFRGIINIGYTIPLPESLDGHDTDFARGFLHPEMLHGSHWANKTDKTLSFKEKIKDFSDYEYRLKILFWPWRAKMSLGWRLLILPYLLDWSQDWQEFAGTVDPNYKVIDGNSIGSGLKWCHPIEKTYNYYNIETVIAYKREITVPKDTLLFCAVPYFDPDLYTQQTGKSL